jgi:hypothetical protein
LIEFALQWASRIQAPFDFFRAAAAPPAANDAKEGDLRQNQPAETLVGQDWAVETQL